MEFGVEYDAFAGDLFHCLDDVIASLVFDIVGRRHKTGRLLQLLPKRLELTQKIAIASARTHAVQKYIGKLRTKTTTCRYWVVVSRV